MHKSWGQWIVAVLTKDGNRIMPCHEAMHVIESPTMFTSTHHPSCPQRLVRYRLNNFIQIVSRLVQEQ